MNALFDSILWLLMSYTNTKGNVIQEDLNISFVHWKTVFLEKKTKYFSINCFECLTSWLRWESVPKKEKICSKPKTFLTISSFFSLSLYLTHIHTHTHTPMRVCDKICENAWKGREFRKEENIETHTHKHREKELQTEGLCNSERESQRQRENLLAVLESI